MVQVKNVYYMLIYAYKLINIFQGKKLPNNEELKNIPDLLGMILTVVVEKILQLGLDRDYVPFSDTIPYIRGKINIKESLKTNSYLFGRLNCNFDEFLENSYPNKIIKTSLLFILRLGVSDYVRKKIHSILSYFKHVDEISPYHINWNYPFKKPNQHYYKIALYLCKLFLNNKILSVEHEKNKNVPFNRRYTEFFDQNVLWNIFELFIAEYCKDRLKSVSGISVKSQSCIPWTLLEEKKPNIHSLPRMQYDLLIKNQQKLPFKTLIIDTKCYSSVWSTSSNAQSDGTLNSEHIYQIQSYVLNYSFNPSHLNEDTEGMLLYAGTEKDSKEEKLFSVPNFFTSSKFNPQRKIIYSANTLDLSLDFRAIINQLDALLQAHLSIELPYYFRFKELLRSIPS